jgi:hypothetical protein
MIKIRIAFAYILVVASNSFVANVYSQNAFFKEDLVATINGEKLCSNELIHQINFYKAKVYASFIDKYKIQDGSFSWSQQYGQEVPWEVLKDKALKEALRIKLQLLLMKEKGLRDDISYAAFKKELQQVNQKRKKAVANHEVVYGPVEYSEKIYFNYLFSNNLILLKKSLQQKEIPITDPLLKAYYEGVKENYKGTSGNYPGFEEIKNALTKNYVDTKYEELIDHWMLNSTIEINRKVYDQLIPY